MPSVRSERDGGIATLTIDRETLGALEAALRLGKEAVYTPCEMEYLTSMRYLREMIVLSSRSEGTQERIRACFGKRKPVWNGR